MREVEAHDLELFAINTGELYQQHLRLARDNRPLKDWKHHVKWKAVPLYSRQVEPVWASDDTICTVAMALDAYYRQHVKEGELCSH